MKNSDTFTDGYIVYALMTPDGKFVQESKTEVNKVEGLVDDLIDATYFFRLDGMASAVFKKQTAHLNTQWVKVHISVETKRTMKLL